MRIALTIAAVATLFVLFAWSHNPTAAVLDQSGVVSIDPTAMMATAGSLPTGQYDAF